MNKPRKQILEENSKKKSVPSCTPSNLDQFLEDGKILAILATSEWSTLYNNATKDVVENGADHPNISNYFYSSFLNVVRNNNATIMRNKRHLHQDGVVFFHTFLCPPYVSHTSRPLQMPLNIAKIKPDENTNSFAARLIVENSYIEDSTQFRTTIPDNNICNILIHGLPPESTTFKQKH